MDLVLWDQLKNEITTYGSSVIAFSGGVDSTLLLKAAVESLGKERVVAITAVSGTYSEEERLRAIQITSELGVAHVIFPSDDFRPGLKAIDELNKEFSGLIKSPLKELGWDKKEIRRVSKEQGLVTWDLPSAACLASRIAYGIPLSEEKLELVGEVETFLKQWVEGPLRFRHHGNWARIEVEPKDWAKITALPATQQIVEKVKSYGFDYVTLDLSGLKSGSMNVGIETR